MPILENRFTTERGHLHHETIRVAYWGPKARPLLMIVLPFYLVH